MDFISSILRPLPQAKATAAREFLADCADRSCHQSDMSIEDREGTQKIFLVAKENALRVIDEAGLDFDGRRVLRPSGSRWSSLGNYLYYPPQQNSCLSELLESRVFTTKELQQVGFDTTKSIFYMAFSPMQHPIPYSSELVPGEYHLHHPALEHPEDGPVRVMIGQRLLINTAKRCVAARATEYIVNVVVDSHARSSVLDALQELPSSTHETEEIRFKYGIDGYKNSDGKTDAMQAEISMVLSSDKITFTFSPATSGPILSSNKHKVSRQMSTMQCSIV